MFSIYLYLPAKAPVGYPICFIHLRDLWGWFSAHIASSPNSLLFPHCPPCPKTSLLAPCITHSEHRGSQPLHPQKIPGFQSHNQCLSQILPSLPWDMPSLNHQSHPYQPWNAEIPLPTLPHQMPHLLFVQKCLPYFLKAWTLSLSLPWYRRDPSVLLSLLVIFLLRSCMALRKPPESSSITKILMMKTGLKVLNCFEDHWITYWAKVDHEQLINLTFSVFMTELHHLYLQPMWEEITCANQYCGWFGWLWWWSEYPL